MNPFANTPAGACGERGFTTAVDAKRAAISHPGAKSFAVMECKGEFAWVAPVEVVLSRMLGCQMAGIQILEMASK